jgi:hypothetical protein
VVHLSVYVWRSVVVAAMRRGGGGGVTWWWHRRRGVVVAAMRRGGVVVAFVPVVGAAAGGGGGARAAVRPAGRAFFVFRKSLRLELCGPLGTCPPRGAPHALGEDLFAGGAAP